MSLPNPIPPNFFPGMATLLNSTHDPNRLSWVESANDSEGDFPLQNLPFGVYQTSGTETARIGVAIGDQVFDLAGASSDGLIPDEVRRACCQPSLNALMALGPTNWTALRARLSELLGADTCPPGPLRDAVWRRLSTQTAVRMLVPARVENFTDFYASSFHAATVGSMFRPDSPLLPNYKWVPIGYHGRASSIIMSGTPVRRPLGQLKLPDQPAPVFCPTRSLDYELELAAYIGPGNPLGSPIPVARAREHLFGVSLLNDWSARDIQSWEYQPLGPFLAKNFATSVSPWVVTLAALEPFRAPALSRPAGDPAPLPHLADPGDQADGGLDVVLEALILTSRMRAAGESAHRLSQGNFSAMYWTLAQMVAHHTSNGCNLRPGDVLGSGTVSGPEPASSGCLLELTRGGTRPLTLPNGETRAFLQDGDEVILRGFAQKPGFRRIGLGECRGLIQPAGA